MTLLPKKLFKRDYLQMVLKDVFPLLRRGQAAIRGHLMRYPHWPYFYGVFYEIFIDDNYRVDGLRGVRYIVDAGANIGVSAVYFAETYPDARIDCFEPNPESRTYLEENTASYPNVTVHPYALGERDGDISFYVDAEIQGSSIASAVNLLQAKRRPSREISVPMRMLSSYLTEPVDILKLDVEGGEMGIMKDLVSSGAIEKVRVILMEFHHDPVSLPASLGEMLALLEKNGFAYYVRKGAMVTHAEMAPHSYMILAFRR